MLPVALLRPLHCTALQEIVAAALVSLGFTPTDWACDVDAVDDKVASLVYT